MTEQELAERHGLTLCDHCGQPREMHGGFDHGAGKCLLDTSGLMIRAVHGQDALERLAAFLDARQALDNLGAGI